MCNVGHVPYDEILVSHTFLPLGYPNNSRYKEEKLLRYIIIQ